MAKPWLTYGEQAFVKRYRQDASGSKSDPADVYATMPIWAAVEVFSFGTLSRLIEASGKSGVLESLADSLSVSPKTLPSQVKSFVYLRNRVAHCARLWNHSVLDVPGLLPNIARRAKKKHRPFSDHSIYKVLVALDDIATKNGIAENWLSTRVEPLLERNPLLGAGIAAPARYGEMLRDLLVPEHTEPR